MKKADILVIALVLLLSVGFYVVYFSNNLIVDDESAYYVEIYYRNNRVYRVILDENTNERIKLTTKDNFLYVEIDSNSDNTYDNSLKPIATTSNNEILNIVSIEYDHIHMEDANCENKLCMNMRIGKTLSTPIFCTNDILVKLISDEYWVITG